MHVMNTPVFLKFVFNLTIHLNQITNTEINKCELKLKEKLKMQQCEKTDLYSTPELTTTEYNNKLQCYKTTF